MIQLFSTEVIYLRVAVCSTYSENIDKKYYDASKEVLEFLAQSGCDLNWGSGSLSLMGLSYNVFKEHNRKIYGYTTQKYVNFLEDLKYATHTIYDTTFDLKKNLFESSDFILILPGGIGTVSEFLAYLEEIRSNDKLVPLILYNAYGHYDTTIALIDDLIKRSFNNLNIRNFFKVVDNIEDFKKIYGEINN